MHQSEFIESSQIFRKKLFIFFRINVIIKPSIINSSRPKHAHKVINERILITLQMSNIILYYIF